jgi:hypothetical protein
MLQIASSIVYVLEKFGDAPHARRARSHSSGCDLTAYNKIANGLQLVGLFDNDRALSRADSFGARWTHHHEMGESHAREKFYARSDHC